MTDNSRAATLPSAPSPRRPARSRTGVWVLLLSVAILVVLLTSAATGPLGTTPLEAARIILGHLLPGMPWMSDGSLTGAQDQAVWMFRLPRTLLAGIAGASLALAGALLQTNVRNPLAEPYILGVSAGAGVGAVLAIVAGSTAVAGLSLNAAAFVGAIGATFLVYVLARQGGIIAPSRLILAGVALGSLLAAITNFLTLTTSAQNVYSVLFFLLGSVSAATYGQLLLPAGALVLVGTYALLRSRALNAMLAGDETATALGVNVPALRRTLLLATALLTATTVAVCGGIGFVGLVVPHVIRMIVGADHRRMIPLVMLGGAFFLMLTDLLARSVAQPAEIPLGILTSVVGAPFFLWIMRTSGARMGGTR
ncbi:iron complex transport system permease protein [Mycetocola sp. BIGb0189]|uniref:FecCD family ABC transporter permease n=1 Tax=Mycetocola sp. BIGb0189 TaxID=2940604 RepID=UPI00216796A8|nr:iron ABC transporter permease [Mycetocola sp. BIGb0189]MCS4275902.1 iron complex transport system permease protein [Mycetocola sp. BIGb0189]